MAVVVVTAALLIPIGAGPANAATQVLGEIVDIGAPGTDLELDQAAGLAYITLEGLPKIAVVDVDSRTMVSEITVAGTSVGISLSDDGTRLYVAYLTSGAVAEVDTQTGMTLRTFDIRLTMGADSTYDVQVIGDELFATPSSDAGSVVKIDLTTETKKAVAAGHEFNRSPRLIWGGTDSLYVSQGSSPNKLFRLDLTDPDAPVVAQAGHTDADRAGESIVAASGTRVLTAGGQLLDAETLALLGEIPEGLPRTSQGGSTIFFTDDHSTNQLRIRRYNLTTGNTTGVFDTTCGPDSRWAADMAVMPGNSLFVVPADNGLCIVDRSAPIPECNGSPHTILGTADDDTITGTAGDDVIVALSGDDVIDGGGGNDVICAGDGDDIVVPDGGDNHLSGGDDVDTLTFADSPSGVDVNLATGVATGFGANTLDGFENVIGSELQDTIRGSDAQNVLNGLNGPDLLIGGKAKDWLYGGKGNDILRGGGGPDRLWGESNDDLLFGGNGPDVLRGGTGSKDVASYENATGPIVADLKARSATGEGADKLLGVERLVGSKFADTLNGSSAANLLFGGPGADTLNGRGGADILDGWTGNDTISGGDGEDVLVGYTGSDILRGGAHNDVLAGEKGDDTLDGGSGLDTVSFELSASGVVVSLAEGTATGEGVDSLVRIRHINGSDHNDILSGDGKLNVLVAGDGDDDVSGKGGQDGLDGGPGVDILRGGSGDDVCANGETYVSCEHIDQGDTASDTHPLLHLEDRVRAHRAGDPRA